MQSALQKLNDNNLSKRSSSTMIHSILNDNTGLNFIEKDNHCAVLGNSLEVLKKVKDNTFKLIFADPPYNIGKTFGKTKEKWKQSEYVEWCKIWIDESMRTLTEDGVLCFMSATQFMPYLDCYVDSKYSIFSRIIWFYDSSGVQPKYSFGSMYEPIIIVAKNKNSVTFNKESAMVEAKTGSIRKLIDYRKTPPQQYNTRRIMGNVWEIPRVRFRMKEYETHPTQKPEKLLERIVKIFTNKNDMVLDPFAGTFTTCVVSKNCGRRSVGIEIEEEYYQIGLRRVGLASKYKNKKLVKEKNRITRNKSKKDHLNVD